MQIDPKFEGKAWNCGQDGFVDWIAPSRVTDQNECSQWCNGYTFTNAGAPGTLVFELPTGPAKTDWHAWFVVAQSTDMQVRAPDGAPIRMRSTVSTPEGCIRSSVPGSCIRLAWVGSEWVVTSAIGTWGVV